MSPLKTPKPITLEGDPAHVSPKQTSSEESIPRFQSRFTQVCRAGPGEKNREAEEED
jgi:hypothetical protein